MKVSENLLQSLHVGVRGGGSGGAEDAQRRGNIGARANGRVLEIAQETGVDVLRHAGERGRVHVSEAGEEAGIHGKGRRFRVGHAVLGDDVAQVLGLVQRDGACGAIAVDVHAE
jgi:hypothetical protein